MVIVEQQTTVMAGVSKMGQVLDEIRRAIEKSEHSGYAICRGTGIDKGHLSRLMAGKIGLSIESLERLADFLGLEIVIRPTRRKRKGG